MKYEEYPLSVFLKKVLGFGNINHILMLKSVASIVVVYLFHATKKEKKRYFKEISE